MTTSVDRGIHTQLAYGFKVSRAAAALPQTAQSALFTVSGGRVAILGVIGEVTTIIQNQACNTQLIANPTTGTDAALCAVLSIANDEVGCLYGITGIAGDAMVGASAGSTALPQRATVVPAGTVDLKTEANNTGEVKWDIYYLPLDVGAVVTAA